MKTAVTLAFAGIVLSFAACKKDSKELDNNNTSATSVSELVTEKGQNPDEAIFANDGSSSSKRNGGYVYTESNDPGQNKILCYRQNAGGHLMLQSTTASGGEGSGDGLGSQEAVVIDEDHDWLFAVNAGSNSVSSFKIKNDGNLVLASTVSSGGMKPVSLAISGRLLYVVNTGGNNIQGIKIGSGGSLTAIAGAIQPLSAPAAGAAQVSFSPNGRYLYVTEKATNTISRFSVSSTGMVSPATAIASTGMTPFGFAFARNYMVVSNAAGGAAGASSATSYSGTNSGNLSAVNGAVNNGQAAACWIATTEFGRYAFATNTASDNISSYYVAPNGALTLVVAAIASGDGPIDMVVAENNVNAYVLCGTDHTIQEYRRTPLGGLALLGAVTQLPAASAGLATW